MEGELSTTKLLTPAALSSMKRSQLQKLCKKYGLKANGKNTDLQEKLKEYALNSGENISTEDIEMMYTPDMYMSSQRNQYANSVSEPTTPQTPSVIPLEQQNRVRRSLVDDSPIKIETSQPSQHEFKEFEAEVVHENKCLSLIPYQGSLFFNLAEKQEENMTESKKDEMEDVNNIENVDYTRDITKSQITEHLVPDEKTNLNPISLNSAFEQVEINKPVMPNIFVSPLTPSSNVIPIEQRTSKEERENDVSVTVHKELETRVAVLKALPSPERKRILGLNNAKSEIPMATPFRKDSEASIIKQTSSSSANRFAKVHEKVFSQMPSIMTHYAAQKTKKVEETQDEVNRKRKDLDSMQPLVKKQKLAHSSLENQSIKAANNVYKKDKSVVKKTYEGNRTIKYSRSSVRLAKSTNVFPNQEERKKEREELEKRKQAARNEVLAKSKNVFPNQERKKELEKRKQTARSVIQPVLKTETKESVAKNSQNTQNLKIKKPRPSLLPRRVSQKKLSK